MSKGGILFIVLTFAIIAAAWFLLALFTSGCADEDDDNDVATDADTDADGDSDADADTGSESEYPTTCTDGYGGYSECFCNWDTMGGGCGKAGFEVVGAGEPLCSYNGRCCCRD